MQKQGITIFTDERDTDDHIIMVEMWFDYYRDGVNFFETDIRAIEFIKKNRPHSRDTLFLINTYKNAEYNDK